MTTANPTKANLLRALGIGLFAMPVLIFTASWPGSVRIAKGEWTNTGKIYQTNATVGQDANSACFTDTRTPASSGLRDPNRNAMANNWRCKCVTGISDVKEGFNPPLWLTRNDAADPNGLNPDNWDYEAKLRENNAVQNYCECRNTESAGYCSCVFADKRPSSDCKQYKPPS